MIMRRLRSIVSAAIVFASVFVGNFQSVSASSLVSVTDELSRLKVSTAANHTLRFSTPTGVDASTDTIILTFFVRLFTSRNRNWRRRSLSRRCYGFETSETIAASSAAGVWGVSIVANAITLLRRRPMPRLRDWRQRIHRNPNWDERFRWDRSHSKSFFSANRQRLQLSGTFGDDSNIDILIISDDAVSVSATVEAPIVIPPSGGGPGDTVAPTIFNVQVINITTSTATIVWDTSESAKSDELWDDDRICERYVIKWRVSYASRV